jgi:hypothetical protein
LEILVQNDEYRAEHVKFHKDRTTLFMNSARLIKELNIIANTYRGFHFDHLDNTVVKHIQGLVKEARRESLIVRWWKNMSESEVEQQRLWWDG